MHNDKITVWAIVGSIMLGFFAALVVTTVFAWMGRPVPEPIGHLLDASFGALSTLLAQTRGRDEPVATDAK